MQPIHLAIGLVEGLITAAVLYFVYKSRPEILESSTEGKKLGALSLKKPLIGLLIAAVLTGGVLSLFASSYPDGLEWSMENVAGTAELSSDEGLHQGAAQIQEKTAVLPDYGFSSGENPAAGTSVSGIVAAG
jgi:cobalt/nickel transport system permease protein